MATYTLTPDPWQQFTDSLTGALASNGTVQAYAAGSTTPIAVYKDNSGTAWGPGTGTVTLDSLGRATIYLLAGTAYKYVVSDSVGNIIRTQDNITGVGSTTLITPLAQGGTGADLSLTGGTSQVVQQASAGAVFTLGQLASTNLSDVTYGNTFTPAITLGGGNTGITYSYQLGRYYQTGKLLLYSVNILLTSKGSSTGSLLVTGLPVAAKNTSNAFQCCTIYSNTLAAGIVAHLVGLISPNTTTIGIYKMVTGTETQLADTDLTNSSLFVLSGALETN